MNFHKICEQRKTSYINYINSLLSKGEKKRILRTLYLSGLDLQCCKVTRLAVVGAKQKSNFWPASRQWALPKGMKTITAGVLQRNSIDYTFCNRIALVNTAFTETCRQNGENIFPFQEERVRLVPVPFLPSIINYSPCIVQCKTAAVGYWVSPRSVVD